MQPYIARDNGQYADTPSLNVQSTAADWPAENHTRLYFPAAEHTTAL